MSNFERKKSHNGALMAAQNATVGQNLGRIAKPASKFWRSCSLSPNQQINGLQKHKENHSRFPLPLSSFSCEGL